MTQLYYGLLDMYMQACYMSMFHSILDNKLIRDLMYLCESYLIRD